MKYLHWDQKTISDFSEATIADLYAQGYVFTRIGKGIMQQTRSVRINLKTFNLSSENRRIIKKVPSLSLRIEHLPKTKYDWNIGKLAKDFYSLKFGPDIMSAQKIKEMLTIPEKSNFNTILTYSDNGNDIGYTISYLSSSLIHYSYPFYDTEQTPKDTGLGMMILAIQYAKEAGLSYIYLGSLQRPSDTYKLQFEGLEWFDGNRWNTDTEEIKDILKPQLQGPTLELGLKHIHIIGISGVATSALAVAFHRIGWKVTGSDKGFFPPASTELENQGVYFYAGWHPEKMVAHGVPNIIIIGTASGSQNPETLYAKEHGIPIYSYPEAIGKFFVKKHSIVVTGTWGKTSSSALLSHILDHAGFDPTYMFGGISLSHDASARITQSNWNVFEGDEYKSSPTDATAKFFYYKPTHLLLTAVSWDHADLYPTEKDYFNTFKKLLSGLPSSGIIIANKDNAGVNSILSNAPCPIITYGSHSADYTYAGINQNKKTLSFTLSHAKNTYTITSPLIGSFQAENITGCFAMANTIGIPITKIIQAIASFTGMKRRLEKRLDGDNTQIGVTVFDDIAHSPEKASSVLKTLRNIYQGKITVIFEPNIGGRRNEALAKYDNAFNDATTVIIPRLTTLKVADGDTHQAIDGEILAQTISRTHTHCIYIPDDELLVKTIVSQAQKGDIIVFLGSHGFRTMIEATVTSLHQ